MDNGVEKKCSFYIVYYTKIPYTINYVITYTHFQIIIKYSFISIFLIVENSCSIDAVVAKTTHVQTSACYLL